MIFPVDGGACFTAPSPSSSKNAMQNAWNECLKWMQREVDLCRKHGMAVVLLVTPVNFQLRNESRTHAQRTLAEFASRNDIAYVDLLTTLRERVRAEVVSRDPTQASLGTSALVARHPLAVKAVWRRYFLDHDHLTPAGHELVADVLAPMLQRLATARATGR